MVRFAVVLACASLTACSDTLGTSAQRLAGSWTWVSSFGGLGGRGITPESAGYTERLVFLPFMGFSGVVERYRDSTVQLRRRYRLRHRDEGHGEQLMIEYEGGGAQFLQFHGDTLTLIDYCIDCYDHRYVRGP